jgi:type 1 glutamine amidotransferase
MLGEKTRAYAAVHSEDPAFFDAEKLAQFDAVVMLNTTGDCLAETKEKLTAEQEARLEQRKENLRQFVEGGKGLLGIHSATDTFYSWKVYGDMIGGWFKNHPWHTEVPIKVDSPGHPLTTMFDPQQGFVIKDEIYQFAPRDAQQSFNGYQPYSRDKLRVLLSLDNRKFDVSEGERGDADYAISWVRSYGQGRVFYTVLGHNDFIYWHPVVLKHYLAGVQFVLGDLPADTTPSNALSDAK